MPRNNKSPPSSPSTVTNSDKHAPITPIKIVNRNTVLKTANTNFLQCDNTNDRNIDDTDWITVEPKSPNVYKKHKPSISLSPKQKQSVATHLKQLNKFTMLNPLDDDTNNMDTDQPNINSSETETVTHTPPPIFIKSSLNYNGFCNAIKTAIGSNDFTCKSNLNELKLQTFTPIGYRNVIHLLKEKNVNFHTYQLQQEKPFRVVIRNLHHTTDINYIKEELEVHGYTAVQVVNVLQWQSKKPLPLFFVDLKPDQHNSEIFKLSSICFTKIKVEEPRPRQHLIQCQRCQNFGHTKTYCNHQPRCVKCSESHLTKNCQKSIDQPPKCVLCEGQHPASYRGCPFYQDIQSKRKSSLTKKLKTDQNNTISETNVQVPAGNTSKYESQNKPNNTQKTYSKATQNPQTNNQPQHNNNDSLNLTNQLSSFISELKSIINPLITLLTTVINKFLLKND